MAGSAVQREGLSPCVNIFGIKGERNFVIAGPRAFASSAMVPKSVSSEHTCLGVLSFVSIAAVEWDISTHFRFSTASCITGPKEFI